MSEKSILVTETMDGAKDGDTDVATAPATNAVAPTDIDVPTATVNDTNVDLPKTQTVETESTVDRKPDVAVEASGVKVIEGNDSATDDDKLTAAMASTTISATDESKPKDSSQNPSETVSDRQPQTQEPIATAKETGAIVDETNVVNPNEQQKFETDEEANSTSLQFEDAREFLEGENDGEERPQNDDEVNQQNNIPDGESGGEDLLNQDEAAENEDGEDPSDPTVPVPVDDDTNDPQYIPRRGRFYEHDDRMAYSTTSSEGSESEDDYDYSGKEDEEGSGDHRVGRRRTSGRKSKSTTAVDTAETIDTTVENSKISSKKVLAISKVNATVKNPAESPKLETSELAKKPGSRKSRDIDSLDRWDHDMYNEHEQTSKTRDELLASYGYDIREESEAPRARRHHKYGRAATAKYTRNWQDTKAYSGASGPQSLKVRRGGMAQRSGGPSKNKSKSDEYSADFPALDGSKSPKSTTENPSVVENSSQKQQQISLPVHEQERNTIVATSKAGPSPRQEPPTKTSTKFVNSQPNRHQYQDQQNGGSPSSSNNKNYFNRHSVDSSDGKEKNIPFNKDYSSPANNFFNRKPQPQHNNGNNQHQNYKQHHYNNQGAQGYNQHNQHTPSAPRGRNFHQHHNSPQQYNRDRYFAKGSAPPSSSNPNQPYNQQHRTTIAPTTAGTGRTQHSGGHYHQYNNRQYENENQQIDQSAQPVVRSSKRYSVQSRRELPEPVLNFSGMSKTPQPSQQSVPQHPQQNGLVMQEQQQTMQQIQQPPPQQIQQPPPQQIQQPQAMQIQQQIHQQQPPPIQIQQYHPPLQQIHPHHGMVLDHNTGMMVMAAGDPSMYQLYAAPQYATGVTPGSNTGGADDPNAVAAAAALQMLAAQAAVYQPVPTGAPGVTPSPSGAQSLQQQQPETFMTTYYQPQQQPQQQPPPRRVNLAIPIVAPPPEHTVNLNQQGTPKTTISPTPPPTAASIN